MNTIALAKKYVPLIDEVYVKESVTQDLNSSADIIKAGANANEIMYPKISVSGLGDYQRNSSKGYSDGNVTVEWETTKFNYDRGTKISVDAMDDEETFEIAFGKAASTLMSTKVAPEGDAFTFATIAGKAGITTVEETIADGEAFLKAILNAMTKMDEDEVPEEGRILYATPTLINSIIALDTYKSREVLNLFKKKIKVPQRRFYTAIDLLDGRKTGEEAGHFCKAASGGADINFMIVDPTAIIKHDKHVITSIIAPEANPDSDAYICKYRKYAIVDVFANKVKGVYCSHKSV